MKERLISLALLGLMVAAGGCSALNRSAAPSGPREVMSIYYCTDRDPVRADKTPYFGSGRKDVRYGAIDVGVSTVQRAGEGAVQRPPVSPGGPGAGAITAPRPLDKKAFLSASGAHAASGPTTRPILVFVHGFNVAPDSAIATTAQVAYDLGFTGDAIAFVWPSQGKLERYWQDEESAQWAVPHLAELLQSIHDAAPDRPIDIVAHSMGTRVTCGALQRLACRTQDHPQRMIAHLVLAAADIDADIFKDQVVPEIRPLVGDITLYASKDDRALQTSQDIHQWVRAGETGNWMPPGETRFQMVDCTGIDMSRSVGDNVLGHSYYDAAYVTQDIQSVLGTTTKPRPATKPAGASYWTVHPPKPASPLRKLLR